METSDVTIARKRMILEFDSSIGHTISELRTARNLKQEDIADALGCGQPLISRLEAGQRSLKFAEVGIFAEALGMTREELVMHLLTVLGD